MTVPKHRASLWASALALGSLAVASPGWAGGVDLPVTDASRWSFARRGEASVGGGSLKLRGKMALWAEAQPADLELRVRARMTVDGEIWVRFRYSADDTHYALALRGRGVDDLFLYRFAPGGEDRLLGSEPLGFDPVPGAPYELRIRTRGDEISVRLGDEPRPRLLVTDVPSLPAGRIGVGGGPFPTVFESVRLAPLEAAETRLLDALAPDAVRVNFQPRSSNAVESHRIADGSVYDPSRGHGWTHDMQGLMRERAVGADRRLSTLAAVAHGTPQATFVLDCPDGDYVLTAVGGDPQFPSRFELYVDDETAPSVKVDLAAGQHHALRRPVTVRGRQIRLTLKTVFPPGGTINWLALERRASSPEKYAAVSRDWAGAAGGPDPQARDARAGADDREAVRARQRAAVAARELPSPVAGGRLTVDLGGDWLLLPETDPPSRSRPQDPSTSDEGWHVVPVPAFLKPVRWWIYGPGEGTSDAWVRAEERRCSAFTFDYAAAETVWYRKTFRAPASYAGRDVRVAFRGVASTAEVWLNGRLLGSHVGMFAPFELDASRAIRPGALNTLAVRVGGRKLETGQDPGQILGTAISMELTREMLLGLPRGMYGANLGIWQPVKLVVTDPLRIADAALSTSLTGLALDLRIANAHGSSRSVRVAITIRDRETGETFHRSEGDLFELAPNASASHRVAVDGLSPKPWSPGRPNLYDLEIALREMPSGASVDRLELPLGFRSFEVRGNRFYLNGKPYWLRGANLAPHGLRPNDPKLARAFLRRMREGNTVVTRTHASPFSDTWLDAADEEGIGVSVEGAWPWVLGPAAPIPSSEMLAVWRAEWLALVRAARNHPSVLMWTLNNESRWYYDSDPAQREAKWAVATEMIRATREADPSRPVIADSAYVSTPSLRDLARRRGLDEGDADDLHAYYGWYTPSPFTLQGGKIDQRFTGERPAISQELSTGYPNNDTGHPTRKYVDRHYVAQIWCGDWAYEDRDPAPCLERHAFLTKELGEMLRRERDRLAGVLHFSNANWWRHVFDAERLEPYPAWEAMRIALAPLLVSLEMRERRFFAGDTLAGRVAIVHDDPERETLPEASVRIWIEDASGRAIAQTRVAVGETPYYGNTVAAFALAVPEELPRDKDDYALRLELLAAGGQILATNRYALVLATRAWAERPESPGVRVVRGEAEAAALDPAVLESVWREGGGLLLLNAGRSLSALLPGVVAGFRAGHVEVAGMEIEEHPAFDGIEPLELSWFSSGADRAPYAAAGAYRLETGAPARVLLSTVWPHDYLKRPTDVSEHLGAVAFELRWGRGRLVAAEIAPEALGRDPVASRLVRNLLAYLSRP